jgi:hypothetical protein
MKTLLTNIYRRIMHGPCNHEGFFTYGDNEMTCLNCGYVEKLR